MATNTPNLGLLKKDPTTDGNDTFNIKTMLNDNWDKLDAAVGDIPDQVAELAETAVSYKDIPPGTTSVNGLIDIGVYFTPNLASLSDVPVNPVEGNWTNAHATINVYNVSPPYAGPSFLRVIELYITYGSTKQYYFRRNTKISISGGNTTITHASWERMITSAGGTITGSLTVNGTTQVKGPLQAYGDGADALSLIGTTHSYASFYPQGIANGRQGYVGFASSGSKEFNINATDTLRFSDKNGAVTLGQITTLYVTRITNNRAIEIGTEVSGSGPAFIDFHTNTTPGRTDLDARIIASAVDSPSNQQAILTLAAKDVQIQTLTDTFSLSDLKQSGVEFQNKLAAALNASGIPSQNTEGLSYLVERSINPIKQRIKVVTVTGANPFPRGSGNNNEDLFIMPGGYYAYMNLNTARIGNQAGGLLEFYLYSNASTGTNGNNVTVYALDSAGRRADIISFSGSSTVGSSRFFGVNDLVITPTGITRSLYQNSTGAQFDSATATVSVPSGWDISGGVRIRCEILTTAQFYITPRSSRLIGG